MRRRTVLTAAATSVLTPLGGCVDAVRDTGDVDPDIEVTTRLGTAQQVSIEADPDRRYQYHEDTDEVSATRRMPFDEWGTRRAVAHGASHLRTLFEDADVYGNGIRVSSGVAELADLDENVPEDQFARDFELAPIASHEHHYSRDGELRVEPEISFETMREVAPRSMAVTMLFEERDYTAVLPIFCRRTWLQDD